MSEPIPASEVGKPFYNEATGFIPGYVAGKCGHRVAESEWRAGFRTCEQCPDDDGPN